MAGIRQEKIASLLKRELAQFFQRESSFMFGGRFITVTIVRMSPDLGVAKVYLSFMASKDPKGDLEAVSGQAWLIRKKLAETVGKQLRRMPELQFYVDDSLDYYDDIDRLLNS
ncbi:30S ribosome-binding factor RbfA [Sanyastnella coralliicola]|uniref:30S ribosome-binding factor RbfA n=1 Tax=Sanyastnella coralliicola TaxID=3069118 RepID=UPI0027BAFFAD|nr:30S ribosome-binding factor RbfA [Longitalea sp. SCSIO 12813]